MSDLPPGYEPELPPGYEPEHSASPADAGPSPEEAKTISGLTALRAQNPQEDARTLLARHRAGERGYRDVTGGRPARASDAELLQAVRGTLPVDGAESFSRGMLQGASLGFADEAAGGLGALAEKMRGSQGTVGDLYRKNRDESRAAYDTAKGANPGLFRFGDIAGGVASSLIPGMGAGKGVLGAMKAGAAIGAATGLGNSSADLTRGEAGRAAFDAGVGGLVGGSVGGVFGLAGKGLDALGAKFGRKVAAAQQDASAMGAKAAAEATGSARSAAGQDAQALYRALEHIENLRADGSPESLAQLQQLEADGTIKHIKQELFRRTIEELPEKLAQSQASREAYRQALSSEGSRAAELGSAIAKPSVAADAASFAKSYGEPLAGHALMGPMGSLVFARTRAGKALANRVAKPGNQIALYGALQKAVGGGEALGGLGASVTERSTAPQTAASENFLNAFPQLKAAMNGSQQPDEALGANP